MSLACAMIHDPELFILDEPTAALDPVLKRNLWSRFRDMADRGKVLLISTHLMDEAMLCDKVALLQSGHLIAYDAPRNLIARGDSNLHFETDDRHWDETVSAEGTAMAKALQRYGLSPDINKLDIDAENLEDVMVSLLDNEARE